MVEFQNRAMICDGHILEQNGCIWAQESTANFDTPGCHAGHAGGAPWGMSSLNSPSSFSCALASVFILSDAVSLRLESRDSGESRDSRSRDSGLLVDLVKRVVANRCNLRSVFVSSGPGVASVAAASISVGDSSSALAAPLSNLLRFAGYVASPSSTSFRFLFAPPALRFLGLGLSFTSRAATAAILLTVGIGTAISSSSSRSFATGRRVRPESRLLDSSVRVGIGSP